MTSLALRILIAFTALATLTVVIVAQFTALAWPQILLRAGLIACAGFTLLALHILLASRIRAYLLRHGAIDSQWLWFKDYPQSFLQNYRRPD